MKKSFIIVILFTYVISLTEFKQLVKLPTLVEHFLEHREKDNALSLLQFLHMHYASSTVNDADYAEDMKLPFKSHDGCLSASSIAFVPNSFEEFSTKPVISEVIGFSSYSENSFPDAYLSSIWQPPKTT